MSFVFGLAIGLYLGFVIGACYALLVSHIVDKGREKVKNLLRKLLFSPQQERKIK
jgi:NhaP-type Na+/H+ or K+/H+ antiporter